MIYTVTLNPSIDRTMHLERLQVGALNRAVLSRSDLGGKGVNVTRALHAWGLPSVIGGLIAGTYGRVFAEALRAAGYTCDLVEVEGETRSNVTVIDESRGETTKLNEPGPTVDGAHLAVMEDWLQSRLVPGRVFVFSGSLPPGAPDDTYARMVRVVQDGGSLAVLDASGPALRAGCAGRPWLVKPNEMEAAELMGAPPGDASELPETTAAIRALGPREVLLSLGERGGAYDDDRQVWLAEPPPMRAVSAVAAGDCFLAGALWAWTRGLAGGELLRWAVAAGSAAAMTDGSAVPSRAAVEALREHVRVRCLGSQSAARAAAAPETDGIGDGERPIRYMTRKRQ